jgi:hypothetical protein
MGLRKALVFRKTNNRSKKLKLPQNPKVTLFGKTKTHSNIQAALGGSS